MENVRSQIGGGTEQYQKPELEVIELSGENEIVTTSGCSAESCYQNTACSGANCYLDGVPLWGGEGD